MSAHVDAVVCLNSAAPATLPYYMEEGFREFAETLVQNIDEVFFWREVGNLLPYFVSHSFERIFGRPCSTAYRDPSSWLEAIHPDDREQAIKDHQRADTTGTMQMQYRIVQPTGEVRWLWVRIFPAPGEVRSRTVIGIAQDCTERMMGEQDRAFLAAIVQSSDDSIVGTDLNGRILSWNRGAENLLGYTAKEAVGRQISLVFTPETQGDYLANLERFRRNGCNERYEAVRVAKDGTTIDVSVILSSINDPSGRMLGISAIYRDISREKLAKEQLLMAKDAAEETNRAKSEFLANMSHEIRTPMNGVLGMADVLLESGLSVDQREYAEVIHYSATSLLKIINDILDFSKIEARRLTLEQKQFYLADVVDSSVKELETLAKTKMLTLQSWIHPEIPQTLTGDPGRLRQILVNILGNGIKFTRQGGVELRVTPASLDSRTVLFSIRDTGIGIRPEKHEMIFDIFTQVDGSVRRAAGGTGLGLAIASRLVQMMGGKIWVESDGESGTTFHFTARFGLAEE